MLRPIGWAREPCEHGQRPHTHAVMRETQIEVTPNLPTRSAISRMGEPKKPRDRTSTSDTRAHAQDLANDSIKSTNKPECVRTPKDGCTKSNLPVTSPECAQRSHIGLGTTRMHRAQARACTATNLTRKWLQEHAKMSAYLRIKQNGPTHLMAQRPSAETKRMVGGNHVDGSTVLADMQGIETEPKTAKIVTRNVRTCQVGPRRQNLPYRLKIKPPKCPGQQNHVSINGNNVHALHNTPIEAWARETKGSPLGEY